MVTKKKKGKATPSFKDDSLSSMFDGFNDYGNHFNVGGCKDKKIKNKIRAFESDKTTWNRFNI